MKMYPLGNKKKKLPGTLRETFPETPMATTPVTPRSTISVNKKSTGTPRSTTPIEIILLPPGIDDSSSLLSSTKNVTPESITKRNIVTDIRKVPQKG